MLVTERKFQVFTNCSNITYLQQGLCQDCLFGSPNEVVRRSIVLVFTSANNIKNMSHLSGTAHNTHDFTLNGNICNNSN